MKPYLVPGPAGLGDTIMANFPKKENDIYSLAGEMAAGLAEHAADFPSVVPTELTAALSTYNTAKNAQVNTQSQAQLAILTKQESLDSLVTTMKTVLKQAELDVADEPEKLTEIGWAPKKPPTPIPAPGQVDDFHAVFEGPGNVLFRWKSPAGGGAVRSYLIQRRTQPTPGEEFGVWQQVGVSFTSDYELTDQPRGVQMEYRVIASNITGESMPSNIAAVVL